MKTLRLNIPSNLDIDKGEASAIALAMEGADYLLIIDELKGRKLAKQLGLNFTGTLGLIAEAKLTGRYLRYCL